jgi:arylsulfatase A-like enzyme
VVFTSDHGEMAGDHGLLEKRAFYEESAKVPFLIHVPWLKEESRMLPGNVGHIDLVPTLLDLMGQPVPDHLQGVSRVPVFKGEESLEENDVFVQWNGLGDRDLGVRAANMLGALARRSIITSHIGSDGTLEHWKLNLCAGDVNELFDLTGDPHEMTNLFEESDQRDTALLPSVN